MQDIPSQRKILHAYIIKAFLTDKRIKKNQIDLKYGLVRLYFIVLHFERRKYLYIHSLHLFDQKYSKTVILWNKELLQIIITIFVF